MRETVTRGDLQPLEDSELAWRWGSEWHVVLPPDVREQISAFRPAAAQALDAKAHDLCRDEGGETQTIAADRDAIAVSRELAHLGIHPSEEVIVHWGASVAVLTQWDIFRAWWSEFCYPASDDVTIWPLSGGWVLCYDHWEQFRFSRPEVK